MLGPFADAMMTATLQDGLRPVAAPAARRDAPPFPEDVTPEPGLRRAAEPPRASAPRPALASRLRRALGLSGRPASVEACCAG